MSPRSRNGFTLLELSVVLVIIGLLVGGVLVGRDLIEAATIRAQISQIEKYDSAVNAFRTKYNALPGDMAAADAAAVGFTARSGAAGHGDGNGLIESCGTGGLTSDGIFLIGCETTVFWSDLSQANLIDGSFTKATDAVQQVTQSTVGSYFPAAKLGGNNYLGVGNIHYGVFTSAASANYWLIGNMETSDATGAWSVVNSTITPAEANAIDTKTDDGIPWTGRIRGWTTDTTSFFTLTISRCGSAGNGTCSSGTAVPFQYNLIEGYDAIPSCVMSIQMQ